jgi:tetratricopeptide (TPR) repeat protein
MSMVGTGCRLAFFATVFLCSSPIIAFPATDTPKQLARGSCGETMSCVSDVNKTSVVAGGPKISAIPASVDPLYASCVQSSVYRRPDDIVESCERFLTARIGTVRQRAMAMFVLGHSYTRTLNSYVVGQDPNDSKTVKLWQQAAELDPQFVEPHISIGNYLGYSGAGEQAQIAFDKASKINPMDWRIYTGRANAYFNARKFSEALAAAEKSFALAPEQPTVRLVLGRMFASNKRYEEAAKQFEVASINYVEHHDPLILFIEPHPLQSLADVYHKMGKPALAAETISKYIEKLEPMAQYYMYYQIRAGYYESAEMYERAADDLKEAAKRAPTEFSADLIARHAMMLARSGSKIEAGSELRNILARGNLKSILKVQVFLRNQGYDDVAINGKYDELTSRALDACLLDDKCAPGVGQAI